MKKTELKEIKKLEPKQILERVQKLRSDLASLVLEKTKPSKGSKDIKLIFKKRKDIAQMLTILRQKEMLTEFESKQEVA